jgi:MFS family permease
MAASTFGTLGFAAIAPFVRDRFDLSTVEVGALTALVFLGAMVASVPAGRLTDRLGAPVMLAAAQAGVALGVGISAAAPTRLTFLAGVAVAGLAYGAVNPPTNVLASDAVPRRHRALFLSLKQTGVPLGGLVAGIALPPTAEAVGWRAALLLPIGVLLVAAAVALTLARGEAAQRAPTGASEWEHAELESAPAPSLGPTGAYGFLMAGIQLSFVGYLTVYLVDVHHFTPTHAGLALSVALAGGVAGRIVWGAVSDGLFASHATSLALAGMGSVAGLVVLSFDPHGLALWLAVILIGFCGIGWNGVYLALVADGTRLRALGRATGSALVFLYAGVVALPPLFGVLVDGLESWHSAWLVAAGVTLGAALAMGLAPRQVAGGSGAVTAADVAGPAPP